MLLLSDFVHALLMILAEICLLVSPHKGLKFGTDYGTKF